MTQNPDDNRPPEDPEGGRREGSGADRKLDEDAAWRAIVENYGERPALEDLPPEPPPVPLTPPGEPVDPFPSLHRRWQEPMDTGATWEDEGHFVPPEPPPLPRVEPRRKLAWIGLFGGPALMLLGVVFGLEYPRWLTGMLATAFIGGFVYLVATMPRSRGEDGSGDDGAVV
jgi:hypothetical protein